MNARLPIVGVMGSGQREHRERSEPLGAWLATRDVHLLTGGGAGVMSAVSRAFHAVQGRRGRVLGILPASAEDAGRPQAGYPNPWVEIPVATHLPLSGERGSDPLSRNHINVLSSDVIVALPGGPGTASEVALAVRYGKPVVAFLQRADELPGLPVGVPLHGDLTRVQAFVTSHLSRLSTAR